MRISFALRSGLFVLVCFLLAGAVLAQQSSGAGQKPGTEMPSVTTVPTEAQP